MIDVEQSTLYFSKIIQKERRKEWTLEVQAALPEGEV